MSLNFRLKKGNHCPQKLPVLSDRKHGKAMGVNTTLKGDLKRLKALAYHRAELSGDLLRGLHRLSARSKGHPDHPFLETVRCWLFVPLTLWPIDVDGLGRHMLQIMKSGASDEKCRFMVSLLGEPPSDSAQAVTMQHRQRSPTWALRITHPFRHKYDFKEAELATDPEFTRSGDISKAL